MALPTSRNTTYAPGSQLLAADLNDIQDQIVDLADGVWTASQTINGDLTVSGALIATGIEAVVLGTTNDDLAIDAATAVVRFDTTDPAGNTITGITGGVDGRSLEAWNVDVDDVIFTHDGAGSTAANRIFTPGGVSLTLGPGERAILRYFATDSRWRVMK